MRELIEFPQNNQLDEASPLGEVHKIREANQLGEKNQPFCSRRTIYENAYWNWLKTYKELSNDCEINDISEKLGSIASVYGRRNNWLQTLRQCFHFSVEGVAARLGQKKSSYLALEAQEANGSISLRKFSQVADIYNCDVVYFIVPRDRARLSEYVFRNLFQKFNNHPWVTNEEPHRQGKAIAHTIRRQMKIMKVRQENGWSLPTQQHKNQKRSS